MSCFTGNLALTILRDNILELASWGDSSSFNVVILVNAV